MIWYKRNSVIYSRDAGRRMSNVTKRASSHIGKIQEVPSTSLEAKKYIGDTSFVAWLAHWCTGGSFSV
jgi:hypothetical protein